MKKSIIKSGVVLPLLNKVTKLSTSQIEIPEEWDELFNRKEKIQFIKNLENQIRKTGYCSPIVIFEFDDKYVIVDGVLRFLALQNLNLNQIDCIILDNVPESKDDLKDWIIEFNLKSVPTVEERKKLLSHYLRIVDCESELDETTYNEKYKFISEQYGKGWGRNNVITFKKSLIFEKENPENGLDLSSKILENEITSNKVKNIIEILTNDKYNYNLKKENEAKVIDGFLKGNYSFDKMESLINQYNFKVNDGLSKILPPEKLNSENYIIIWGDSSQTKFPNGTELDAIFTSVPYYKLINYDKKGFDKNQKFEIGQEPSLEEYCSNLVNVFLHGANVLKDTGVICVNLDETYQGRKCLAVTHHFTCAMQDAGFIFIKEAIWHKPDAKPYGNNLKRFNNNFEKVLVFAKSERFFYDKLKIYDPEKSAMVRKGCSEQGNKGLDFKDSSYHISNPYRQLTSFIDGNEFEDIIRLHISHERSQKTGLQNEFFGSFPTPLPMPFIMSYTPENGTVWDPFGGTGTTGLASLLLNRKVIISELYEKNVAKISEILEKGIFEYNEQDYITLKNDLLSNENQMGDAA